MIQEDFDIKLYNMHYTVILSSLKFNDYPSVEEIFDIINHLQEKFHNAIIQFFNSDLIINLQHIFYAIYFSQRAFSQEINISNKISIEFLLYLAANRQIKIAIDSFGIRAEHLNHVPIYMCIVSEKTQCMQIFEDLLNHFDAEEIKLEFPHFTSERIDKIKKFYNISEYQITSILSTLNSDHISNFKDIENVEIIQDALLGVVCEKMALLSLEGVKFD
jgi:tRNA threonylcarbamoyladenosine modification (KEOPS) complex Cgi121 subunit